VADAQGGQTDEVPRSGPRPGALAPLPAPRASRQAGGARPELVSRDSHLESHKTRDTSDEIRATSDGLPAAAGAGHGAHLALLYLFSITASLVIGAGYACGVPSGTSAWGLLYFLLAGVSTAAILNLVPLALAAAPVLLARRTWLTRAAAPVPFGLLNVFLCTDVTLYRLLRRHFDGMAWNVLTTRGASDSVSVGWRTVAWSAFLVALITGSTLAFSLKAAPWMARRLPSLAGRKVKYALAALGLAIAVEKGVFAWGDLADRSEVVRMDRVMPLYVPFTVKRFAKYRLGVEVAHAEAPRVVGDGGSLDYPKAPIRVREGAPRENVLVVAIEGGRFDALTGGIMPSLDAWSRSHVRFENHWSGGNASRYGLFALLYGIHGTYWRSVLAERRGPVMVDVLRRLGYRMCVLSCTDLNFPEFRKTAFVNVPEAVRDTWPDRERVDRDRAMTDAFVEFLDRAPREPFFAFMFYDASHQMYLYPPEHEVFEVDIAPDDFSYNRVAGDTSLARLFQRRYWNSLHYVDSQLSRVLSALEERGLMESTMVFVCGDHGEEFRDLGRFGHTSAYHRFQAKTLMAAHVPGEAPRVVTRFTSHADVPATVLPRLGVENEPGDYTLGTPLTDARGPDRVVVAGWREAALVTERAITVFGLGRPVSYDHEYRELDGAGLEAAPSSPETLELMREMSRFLR
jgi:hypothetical protein